MYNNSKQGAKKPNLLRNFSWGETMCFIKLLKSLKTKTPKGKTVSCKSRKKRVRKVRGKEMKKRRKISMSEKEEIKTTEETSTPTDETSKATEPEKAVETPASEGKKEEIGKEPEGTKEEVAPKGEEEESKPEGSEPVGEDAGSVQDIAETTPDAVGIPVEELVTKEMLTESLAAITAKLDAVLKENTDLKDKLNSVTSERDGLKTKYEEDDFGDFSKKGIPAKDTSANDTFDEYSKKFM